MTPFYRFNRIAIGIAFRLYFRIKVTGQEEIPRDGPCIFAANHASYLDPIAIGVTCPRQISPLAKEELWSVPLLSQWLTWMKATPIKRGKGDTGSLRAALEVLGHGKAILVFPEGNTKSRRGRWPYETRSRHDRTPEPVAGKSPLTFRGPFSLSLEQEFFHVPFKLAFTSQNPSDRSFMDNLSPNRDGYEAITNHVDREIRAIEERIQKGRASIHHE